jgi:hypothetical protein
VSLEMLCLALIIIINKIIILLYYLTFLYCVTLGDSKIVCYNVIEQSDSLPCILDSTGTIGCHTTMVCY